MDKTQAEKNNDKSKILCRYLDGSHITTTYVWTVCIYEMIMRILTIMITIFIKVITLNNNYKTKNSKSSGTS